MRFLKNALRQRKLSLNLTQTPDAIEAKNDEEQSQQGKDTAGQSIWNTLDKGLIFSIRKGTPTQQ